MSTRTAPDAAFARAGLAIASERAGLDRASDEARFLEVRLKREENRVEEALREAIEVAEALARAR